MDNDQKFWLGCWSLVGATLVALTITGTVYYEHKNIHIVEMVKAGHHPIAVKCALDESSYDGAICSQALTATTK